MTGYDRDRFGPAWLDADRNGCDTRNDILSEYLQVITLEDNGCVVAAGDYDDPYTGVWIDYWQGDGALIDIDHVVSLGNAWATGAFSCLAPSSRRTSCMEDSQIMTGLAVKCTPENPARHCVTRVATPAVDRRVEPLGRYCGAAFLSPRTGAPQMPSISARRVVRPASQP